MPIVCWAIHAHVKAKRPEEDKAMHSLIYIVGLIVVIVFVLSLLGLA